MPLLEVDVPLAWISRRVRSLPGVHRMTRKLRESFARAYRGAPSRWTTIDDFEGDLQFHLNRASHMGSAIYWDGHYSLNEIHVLRSLLKPDTIFIDAGAHAGEFTLVAARHAPLGRAIAFEPMPAAFAQLRENLDLNRLPNAEAHPIALSDHRGELELFTGDVFPGEACEDDVVATAFSGHGRERPTAKARCAPLDELAEELHLDHLDVMKLDVEGAETHVLRGAEKILARDHPLLIVEVATPLLEAAGSSKGELFDLFDRHEYRVFLISDYRLRDAVHARAWLRYGRLIEVTRATVPYFCNVLCRRAP